MCVAVFTEREVVCVCVCVLTVCVFFSGLCGGGLMDHLLGQLGEYEQAKCRI